MRGFILNEAGGTPQLGEFREPEVQADGQVICKVLAAGLNPVDRYFAQNPEPLPRVVGAEAIGELEGGQRVYIGQMVAPFGSLAERTVAQSDQNIILPEDLENGAALTLGIAGLAGWLPLSWKAQLQRGESVLVLGATGVQGQIAVQAAKLLGAGHVVAAGRDREVLESLKDKGADAIAVLEGDLAKALKAAAPQGGYQVVVDSLYGEPFAGLLDSGTLGATSRVVTLGGSAGQENTIGFRQLQSTKGATFAGYSSFYVPQAVREEAYLQMAQRVLAGELSVEVTEYSLEQAAEAWDKQASGPHQKIVVVP